MTVTITFDDAQDAQRALAAPAIIGLLWDYMDELRRVARGKVDAAPEEIAAASKALDRLNSALRDEGINLDALWS